MSETPGEFDCNEIYKIIVLGNDGTGKTSVVSCLEKKGIRAMERGTVEHPILEYLNGLVDIDTHDLKEELDIDSTNYRVVVLDSPVDVCLSRIKARGGSGDMFDTEKSLFYFRAKYLELAVMYDFPVVHNNSTMDELVSNVRLAARRSFGHRPFISLTPADVEAATFAQMRRTNFQVEIDRHEIKPEDLPSYAELIPNYSPTTKHKERAFFDNFHIGKDHIRLIREGESKKIYSYDAELKFLGNMCIIVQKPTIYSHSRQTFANIEGLAEVRAYGTQLLLDILWRSGINHTYVAVNNHGVILSRLIFNPPPIEVVFKKELIGTDKHSYYNMEKAGPTPPTPYVRFDWRNPNHVHPVTGQDISKHMFFYLDREQYGEDIFHRHVFSNCTAMGDKAMGNDLAAQFIDVVAARKTAIRTAAALAYAFSAVGIEMKDMCLCLTRDGQTIMSELNQDCMRIKARDGSHLDKDIWRAGGSSVKENILAKWSEFNTLMRRYVNSHPFLAELQKGVSLVDLQLMRMISELPPVTQTNASLNVIENQITKTANRFVITVDLALDTLGNVRQVLVRNGKIVEFRDVPYKIFGFYPDIVCVNMDAALGNPQAHAAKVDEFIQDLATRYYVHAGGGIRTMADVRRLLNASVRRVVVGTNYQLVSEIPPGRCIVDVAITGDMVLMKGRTEETKIYFDDHLRELLRLKCTAVCITLHDLEGTEFSMNNWLRALRVLDRESFTLSRFEKVFIAGGIGMANICDVWLRGWTPFIGSALWRDTTNLGQLLSASLHYDNGLVPAVIQSTSGAVLCLVYMDAAAIQMTTHNRELYRFSRKHGRVMRKGSSTNTPWKVVHISHDCDADALIAIVETPLNSPGFCHTGSVSCFPQQSVLKLDVFGLMQHLMTSDGTSGYTKWMKQHPGVILSKIFEETLEIQRAQRFGPRVHEIADLLFHILLFIAARGSEFDLKDALNELNRRRHSVSAPEPFSRPVKTCVVIGIAEAKYTNKTDDYILEHLGVRIIRPTGRKLRIDYEITDKELLISRVGTESVRFVPMRPKDMPHQLGVGLIDYAVAYSSVLMNAPKTWETVHVVPDPDICVNAYLAPMDLTDMETKDILKNRRVIWYSEHPHFAENYIVNNGLKNIKIEPVSGQAESYVVNITPPEGTVVVCDTVVSTGATAEENGLVFIDTLVPHGNIGLGLVKGTSYRTIY